jgi:6-pyruvoyltetrahydropterin/6-carboxytetrahydropterin synthase
MRVTRRLEFDSGHRIPDHQSQARHFHGHRHSIEVTHVGDGLDRASPKCANHLKLERLRLYDAADATAQ